MILKFQSKELSDVFTEMQDFIVGHETNKNEGRTVWIMEIKKARARRSMSQNSYWWVICSQIALKLECHAEDVHKMLCLEFNAIVLKLPNGKMKLVPRETKELNTVEFSQLVEKGRAWAMAELGLDILSPEQFNEEKRLKLINEYERMVYLPGEK